jgi:hypothetical protein
MHRMRPGRLFSIVTTLPFLLATTVFRYEAASAQPAASRPVEVKVVNYQQLGAAIKQHKGKVVVIDLWQFT